MRDQLAHRYVDAEHAVVNGTVTEDLDPLLAAVHRLRARCASAKCRATKNVPASWRQLPTPCARWRCGSRCRT